MLVSVIVIVDCRGNFQMSWNFINCPFSYSKCFSLIMFSMCV
uniref:Uncharacterized protein n=1 Tax=Rhizophora mucronata TaxID=61149 RepID=A0A2P2PVP6_RHIMU